MDTSRMTPNQSLTAIILCSIFVRNFFSYFLPCSCLSHLVFPSPATDTKSLM